MVVEHLTIKRLKLVTAATALVKEGRLFGTWTKDGKVFIKLRDGTIKAVYNNADFAGL